MPESANVVKLLQGFLFSFYSQNRSEVVEPDKVVKLTIKDGS